MRLEPRWEDAPSDYRDRNPRILIPRPGSPVEGIVVSDALVGARCHWHEGRTIPCVASDSLQCPLCLQGSRSRWKGYLAIWDIDLERQFLAEITDECWAKFIKRCPDHPCLRGYQLRLERLGNNARGRVRMILTPWSRHEDSKGRSRLDPSCLPKPLDVKACLKRIWSARKGIRE